MKKITNRLCFLAAFAMSASIGSSEETGAAAFAAKAKSVAEEALKASKMSAPGDNTNWRFLVQELSHLGQGQFWKGGADGAGEFVETASKKDPRPVIEAYHKELKKRGVRLIVVPVPPKAAIYPQEFWSDASEVYPIAEFYKPLTDAGVEVIDLEPVLRAERAKEGGEKLYCEQDSHPSPYTCKLMAEIIAKQLGEPAGEGFEVSGVKKESVEGDLSDGKKETLNVWTVSKDKASVAPTDKASPVVVLGDSHTLIFQAGGDMLLTQAGLVDHLQAQLGYPVFLQANKGSGIDIVRGNLARVAFSDAKFWEGKKAVIWCFGARMFTQERQWREIPVGK